ncbi:MAG: hypothetical protein JWR75_1983 [Devosia sp.]|nr:hypothetical protein [Devosia sp.]
MLGFQPYETFQVLIETGGTDRTNTLLVAACDAFARRGKPTPAELEQFETLVGRLFPLAAPIARAKAARQLSQSNNLSPALEALIIGSIGDELSNFLESTPSLSDETALEIVARYDVGAAAAVAKRRDLSHPVLAKLFQMNSRKVYRELAANTSIGAQGGFLSALARAAQMDHQVAGLLANRADFDKAMLAPAFFDLIDSDRVKVIEAFAERNTPPTAIKRTLEQLSVANGELTKALMKLFSENRRPEVTRLLTQVTGLDEVRCGQITHDVSGASLFVILRSFGCNSYDGLRVLIHATAQEGERTQQLAVFAGLFGTVRPDAMAYLISVWRGQVNLLDLAKPEYRPFSVETERTRIASRSGNPQVDQAIDALARIGVRRAS